MICRLMDGFRPILQVFPLVQHHMSSDRQKPGCHIADLLTIRSALRGQVEYFDFPDLLRPFVEEFGWDYNRILVDEESYYEGHGNSHEDYGVDKVRGCVVVVRPDQHVVWIGGLGDVDRQERYKLSSGLAETVDAALRSVCVQIMPEVHFKMGDLTIGETYISLRSLGY